jgi:putative serine protease PepD
MAGAMLAAVLIGACGGGAVGATIASHSATNTVVAAAPAAQPGSLAAIYKQAVPGVVTISTEISGTRTRSFGEATGSGIVVDNQGDILTNAHVVANARQITVTFSDGKSATGQVSGVDASNDLAVVKVSVAQDQLHPLTLGNSDLIQVGDTALAIGAPFGLSGTLTAGIISGINRSTTAPNGRALTGMIQTDAPINPGNSGGALLNAQGALIGINDSIQSPIEGSVGVGFAIPVNTAKRLLPSLEKGVAIQHPWLGISGQAITPGLADSLGLSERSGVLVVDVVAGGPAARAGLVGQGSASAGDDIITAIDGLQVKSVDALTQYLDSKQVGDKVTLAVTRGSRHITLSVTLGNFQQQG